MATLRILAIILLFAFTVDGNDDNALQNFDDKLPDLCDAVKCPSMSELTCPDDSSVRVHFDAAIDSTPHNLTTIATDTNTIEANIIIDEEIFAECCLAKKCVCKTCYIPDCPSGKDEVVVELLPESMNKPGRCCGQYECQREPNCTTLGETEHFWLRDCQRCRCMSGNRICHQICDEGLIGKKPKAICNSKNLNTFFEHGDTWKDGCYECECVNGEEKCVTPFCRSINCLQHRQVMRKDSCCPICWPEGIPMPYEENENGDRKTHKETPNVQRFYDENEEPLAPLPQPGNADYAENEIDMLPNIKFDASEEDKQLEEENDDGKLVVAMPVERQAASSTGTSITSSTTAMPKINLSTSSSSSSMSTETTPSVLTVSCPPVIAPAASNVEIARQNTPTTYQVYPEVVEVVRQTRDTENLLYMIIGALVIVVLALFGWNLRLRSKQRSYRPVSIDDNFNKMTCNIKKTNDYA